MLRKLFIVAVVLTCLRSVTAYSWLTPSSLVNWTSQKVGNEAAYAIDGNLSTPWHELVTASIEDDNKYEWRLIADLGSTRQVNQVQIYSDADLQTGGTGDDWAPNSVYVVMVCDDVWCSGESNLTASVCMIANTTMRWQVPCGFTPTSGRYVKVSGGNTGGYPIDTGGGDEMVGLYEIRFNVTDTTTTTTTTTSSSSTTTTTTTTTTYPCNLGGSNLVNMGGECFLQTGGEYTVSGQISISNNTRLTVKNNTVLVQTNGFVYGLAGTSIQFLTGSMYRNDDAGGDSLVYEPPGDYELASFTEDYEYG